MNFFIISEFTTRRMEAHTAYPVTRIKKNTGLYVKEGVEE